MQNNLMLIGMNVNEKEFLVIIIVVDVFLFQVYS